MIGTRGDPIRGIAMDVMTMPEVKGQKRATLGRFSSTRSTTLERSRLAVERIRPQVEEIRTEISRSPRAAVQGHGRRGGMGRG
ncbi:MAG: hypothetical protein M0C28_02925 [Candidatus Moduliflexus flocculans]|nr:hypothetical protein [Candidatus Moduliflexus flocculans]